MRRSTLDELVEKGLDRADYPTLSNLEHSSTTFVTKANLRSWANTELARLHNLIVDSNEEYYLREYAFEIDVSKEDHSLPPDFYKSLRVFYKSGGRRYKLNKFALSDIDGFAVQPVRSGEIEMWYVPQFINLEYGDSEIPPTIARGWEEFVVLGIASRILMKEDPTRSNGYREDQKELEARITEHVSGRDIGEPFFIEDVDGRFANHSAIVSNEGRFLIYRIMGQVMKIYERLESVGVSG